MQYIEGDYIEGDDYDVGDEDYVGAIARQISRPGGVRRVSGGPRQRIFRRPPLPATPAQPTEAELRSYLGLGVATFAIGDAADKVIIVEPQEDFRGERLVVESALVGVTNSVIPLVRRIDVGTQPQSPSVELSAPASMFRPDATYANLDFQVIAKGTKLQLTLGVTAAPVGAAVIVSCGLYGRWIR